MASFHDNSFLGIPLKIRNNNPIFPTVAADQNTISGLGFFTRVGYDSNGVVEADITTSAASFAYYLVNLPQNLRCENYIAILNDVTANDTAASATFVTSAIPTMYVYNGTSFDDATWRDTANWVPVGATSGNSTVGVNVSGSVVNAAAADINFIPTAQEIEISAFNNGDITNVTIGLPNAVEIDTSVTVVNLTGTNSIIGGTQISSNAIVGHQSGKFAGYNGGEGSGFQHNLGLGGNLIMEASAPSISGVKDIIFNGLGVLDVSAGLSIKSGATTSSAWRDSFNASILGVKTGAVEGVTTLTLGGAATRWEDLGGIKVYEDAVPAGHTAKVLSMGAAGALEYRVLGAGAFQGAVTFADLGVTSADGSIVIDATAGDITVNPAMYLTTSTNQVTGTNKGFASIKLGGVNTTEDVDVVVNPLVINGMPTAPTSVSVGSQMSQYLMLLGADGVVRKGETSFVTSVVGGADITVTSPSNNYISTVAVDPVFLRNDSNDSNIYTSTFHRTVARHFHATEYSALVTEGNVEVGFEPTQGANAYTEWRVDGSSAQKVASTFVQAGIQSGTDLGKTWRIGAHTANQSLSSNVNEELHGFHTTSAVAGALVGIPDASVLTGPYPQYAIQIGTGESWTSTYAQQALKNRVTIPHLTAYHLHASNGSYLAGGGSLMGDWEVQGSLTINGVNINNITGGTTTISTSGTLIGLGAPSPAAGGVAAEAGNTADAADIGLFGYYSFTDAQPDSIVDTGEATITGIYRDSGASPVSGYRPWSFVDGITDISGTPSVLMPAAGQKQAPIHIGGFLITSNASEPSGATWITNYVEGITSTIGTAVQNTEYHIPTSYAVTQYVDTAIAGVSFSATDAANFKWGYTSTTSDAEAGTYNAAFAGRLYGESDGTASPTNAAYTLTELGLALDFDTEQTSRPFIGYCPGSKAFTTGTPLKTVIKNIFTRYSFPSISWDANNNLGTEFDTNTYFPFGSSGGYDAIVEIGTEFKHGTTSQPTLGTSPGVMLIGMNSINAVQDGLTQPLWDLSVTFQNLTFTPPGGSAQSQIYGSEYNQQLLLAHQSTSAATNVYLGQIKAMNLGTVGTSGDGWNSLGAGSPLLISDTKTEGYVNFNASITGLVDPSQESAEGYDDDDNQRVTARRRMFYFTSDFSAREYVSNASNDLDDVTFADPCDYAGATDASGGSGKLMHSLIARMVNSSGAQTSMTDLSSVEGSTIANTALPVVNAAGVISNSTTIQGLSLANGVGMAGSTGTPVVPGTTYTKTGQTANYLGDAYISSSISSTLQGNGMLGVKTDVLLNGDTGRPSALPLSTPNGEAKAYTYVAFPIQWSGSGSTQSGSGSQGGWNAGTNIGAWRQSSGGLPIQTIVRKGDGTVATFTYKDKFGADREYALYQTDQPGTLATSGFMDVFKYHTVA